MLTPPSITDPEIESAAKIDAAQLAVLLRQILATEDVIEATEARRPYECDGLSLYSEMPMLVVLPRTAEQAQQVVRLCHRHQVPLVARGAGTGLSGGATPHANGVLLSLTKLNRIIAIDPQACTARVEAGVRNLAISEAVAVHGLFYAPDPSSQIACSIAGNVAENSGGVHCLKYGLTVHNVLKVEALTVTGEPITLGSEGLDSAGMDLLALLNGSEGLLAVVLEVTVKLLPLPPEVEVIMAAYDDVSSAANAVGAVIAAGIIPAGLEMMDRLSIVAIENYAKAGYPVDAGALLLCEVDGTQDEVAEHSARIVQIFKDNGATKIRVAQSEAERALLWRGRKSAFPALALLAPDYYCMDGTIPRSRLAEVLGEISRLSEHYDLQVANVFHAGDGNLHPLILFDASVPDQVVRAEAFGADILNFCVAVGGCITGEHGVGIEKLRQMPVQFTDQELAQFHAVKAAFDPQGTLNPGKGVPQLKYCQEYRALASGNAQPGAGQRLSDSHQGFKD